MGIQAFEPVLVEGNAIRIHPLVCKGFNADFDGDQMAVHLPLSIEAQVEAMTLMMATNNIFSPANGNPIISPTQDIVMGSYYLTVSRIGELGDGMVFATPNEVFLAHSQGKVGTHALIKLRLPAHKRLRGEGEKEFSPGMVVKTTVGRVIFNDILHPRMPYYNLTLGQKQLQGIIADCYQILGRRETIALLDRMKDLGFRESTRSGLSFATDDLKTPVSKDHIIAEAEKEVQKNNKLYQRGIITDQERYNKVLDAWTHARERITAEMMEALRNDTRENEIYLNPIFLMAESGARGGVEQIRQLAGMRGLMAKPSGKIIETPIKANFREGLSVLEYFSSTHGARKGLADTALKTADSGYLTRKLADVAQNVVITMEDCGTSQGITKGVIYKGEKVEVSLAQSIRGRVSRVNIVDPITDAVIVKENEMITLGAAKKLEEMQIEKIQVRSPMTCEASLGVCRACYGMDLATGQLVEVGMAVGIIAAQSIGEPGTQLTMRTFHIGGVATRGVEEKDVKSKREGKVKFVGINIVTNDEGKQIALSRNGEIQVLDAKGRELEKYDVPDGATMIVHDGQQINRGQMLCEWDPHNIPILAEVGGTVRFDDIVEGETMKVETDPSGHVRRTIIEHKGDLHPQIVIEDAEGKTLDYKYIPERASIEVDNGQMISAGTLLAKTPREVGGTQDITGGLPRVTELFEARRPKEPAVIAEIDGRVELLDEKRRGKRTIIVRNESGIEREHLVPHGKYLRVHGSDRVRAGDPLVEGPLVPHDILRISGEEAVQRYLLREIQNVYRSQRVEIDDKHLEIIIAQMLRKVRVESVGDTGLLPGSVIDKFEFRRVNQELVNCIKVKDAGESDFRVGDIVPREHFEQENLRVESSSGKKAEWLRTKPAAASTQLLGITKAAVQSDSFISAASFQETTKVLTEAALAGKVDYLVGLKENVILGHLVPAGTGFKAHLDAEVRIHPEALEALAEKGPAFARYRDEAHATAVKE
jgi:DNA-directed RNA polymerase subunit beta'